MTRRRPPSGFRWFWMRASQAQRILAGCPARFPLHQLICLTTPLFTQVIIGQVGRAPDANTLIAIAVGL